MESENSMEKIDLIHVLSRFLRSMKKFWILTLVLCVLLGGLMYVRAERSFTPYYESRAMFSVSSGYGRGDIFTSSTYYDSSAAKSLAAAFPQLLTTEVMQDLLKAELGTSWINGSISASVITDTALLQVTVKSQDPQAAYDILCAVIEVFPSVAVYMVDDPQIVMRESPTMPTTPINTFSGVGSAVKGVLLGLILGFGLGALHALTHRTICNVDELKKTINLPLLATFPHVILKKRRNVEHVFISSDDDKYLAEALRNLRVKVRKLLADRQGKVVLLTSTLASEGKSTISANLALSLASEGHRVVLVDADLRNQTIYRLFGAGNVGKAMIACLQDPKLDPMDCLSAVPGTNLYYLSGASTSKHHYSIEPKQLRRVLDRLCGEFDYVVVDSPPCGVVSDTSLFARYADSVVYVVRQDHAAQAQILDCIEGLYQRDIPLDGCVLNDVPRRTVARSAGYGYGKEKYK